MRKWGRRSHLLFTLPHVSWSLLALGFCLWIPAGTLSRIIFVDLFVILLSMSYSAGEGALAWVYSAEAFSLSHREIGMAWAVATNNFWAATLSVMFPWIWRTFKPQGMLGFFAGLNLLAVVLIFLFLPETNRWSLEELSYVFGVPTRVHAHHQLTKVLPWWIRRYIFRRREVVYPEFFHSSDPESDAAAEAIPLQHWWERGIPPQGP